MKKNFFYILILLCYACTTAPTKHIEITEKTDIDTLKKFFIRCENDINNAKKVIIDNDIVKNLSHLQDMNYGGKKYYLLEREAITKMIKAVTQGVYTDFILINKKGTIIYTRENDEIFAKNVRTSLKETPLNKCYLNKDIEIYFHDVSPLTKDSNNFYLFVSSKVKGKNTFPGIFILQIDILKIKELLNEKTEIIGSDKIYRIAADHNNINKPYKYYNDLEIDSLDKEGRDNFKLTNGATISYKSFTHKNISWILISD